MREYEGAELSVVLVTANVILTRHQWDAPITTALRILNPGPALLWVLARVPLLPGRLTLAACQVKSVMNVLMKWLLLTYVDRTEMVVLVHWISWAHIECLCVDT